MPVLIDERKVKYAKSEAGGNPDPSENDLAKSDYRSSSEALLGFA
jgi:hypothetical protein